MALPVLPFTPQDSSGQMPPSADNSSSLATSATEASTVSHQQADKLFQMATAIRDASTNMALRDRSAAQQGTTSSTPTMPGIEMPIFNPERQKPLPFQSEMGGGYTNHGLRVSHDKSALINEISAGVQYAVQKHQDNERTKAMMEFRTLMTAIQANKTLDPNDPNNKDDIAHNNEIIKNFFEGKDGKGRTKRLEKIMGFDAFNMKKEEDKKKDPYYQAMQEQSGVVAGKFATASGTGVMSETLPNGAPNPNNVPMGGIGSNNNPAPTNATFPAGMNPNARINENPSIPNDPVSMSEVVPGLPNNPNNAPMWMRGLPASIQRHLAGIPSVPSPVILSRDEQHQALRVEAKIAPSADELVKFQGTMAGIMKDYNLKAADIISAKDLENFKQTNENWREIAGNASAEKIALINARVHASDNLLGWARLGFDQGKFGIEQTDKFGDLMKDNLKAKKENFDAVNTAVQTYLNDKKGKKLPDDKGVELRQAQDDYLNAQYNWNQWTKDRTQWFKDHGMTINPAGSGITGDTLNSIKNKTGAGLSVTAPAYDANTIPGVNSNPGPSPTGNAPVTAPTGSNPYTSYFKGMEVPDSIQRLFMAGKYAKGQPGYQPIVGANEHDSK